MHTDGSGWMGAGRAGETGIWGLRTLPRILPDAPDGVAFHLEIRVNRPAVSVTVAVAPRLPRNPVTGAR